MTSFRPVKTLKTSNSLEVEKNTKAELSLPYVSPHGLFPSLVLVIARVDASHALGVLVSQLKEL